MGRTDVISRLAEYHGCPPSVMTVVWDQAVAAFRQAMTEFGIGDHDGCAGIDYLCCALEPLVTARAFELLGIQEATP